MPFTPARVRVTGSRQPTSLLPIDAGSRSKKTSDGYVHSVRSETNKTNRPCTIPVQLPRVLIKKTKRLRLRVLTCCTFCGLPAPLICYVLSFSHNAKLHCQRNNKITKWSIKPGLPHTCGTSSTNGASRYFYLQSSGSLSPKIVTLYYNIQSL